MQKSTVIGMYGGPGCGKSTTAARLFAELKVRGFECELATEYAKDLFYAERHKDFGNQFYILAKQYHRLWSLNGKVDFIITDSPIFLNYVYQTPNEHMVHVMKKMYDEFYNLNFVIDRTKQFNQNGRFQSEQESIAIDAKIILLMNKLELPYYKIESHDIEPILKVIDEYKTPI